MPYPHDHERHMDDDDYHPIKFSEHFRLASMGISPAEAARLQADADRRHESMNDDISRLMRRREEPAENYAGSYIRYDFD